MFDIYGTLFISAAGDISFAKKTSPEARKLKRLLQKFNIRKTPRDLIAELIRAIEDEHRRRIFENPAQQLPQSHCLHPFTAGSAHNPII